MPQTPGTPGLGNYMGEADRSGDLYGEEDVGFGWILPNIVVSISSSFNNGEYAGKQAVVRSQDEENAVVELVTAPKRTVTLPCGFLELVTPEKRDKVMIIRGSDIGSTGTLIGVDAGEQQPQGVVKLDNTGQYKIAVMREIAKLDSS